VRAIGLVGGLSWESTAVYYQLLNERVRDRQGAYRQPVVILHSLDFAEIVPLQQAGDWTAAGAALAAAARGVVAGGAGVVGICANTMHLVAADVAAVLPPDVELVSVIDATADVCRAKGFSTVGLLGTAYTMEAPFYADGLRAHGLAVLTPAHDDRAEAHRIVYDELVRGVVSEVSRRAYVEIVERLISSGCDAVLLACTELGMLRLSELTDVPVVDTTEVHVDALLAASRRMVGNGAV
jgi:aspartate racemase